MQKAHTQPGDRARQINAKTVHQWHVFDDLDAGENTVAQAVLAFEAKGAAARAKRTLKAHLGNTHASRVPDCRSRFPLWG